MLRHCDRQIPLPASALTHAHATTASTHLRASQQIQQPRTPETGRRPTDQRTWEGDRSHVALTPRRYSGVLSGLFAGYSAGTQRVLRWYSRAGGVEGVGAPVGQAGDERVTGIPVNTFSCTSIERNTETVTGVPKPRYTYSDTRSCAAGVRGTGQHRSSVRRGSARGLGPKWAQLQLARDPVRRKHAASRPRVRREYAVRWYASII